MANLGGRPRIELTDALQKKICDAVRVGNYMEVAAAYCGITKETFYDWMRKGAKYNRGEPKFFIPENEVYARFSDSLAEALAESEVRDIVNINKHAAKNWQAAAWKLERRFGKRWGRKDTIDIEHGGKIETEISAKNTLIDKLSGLIAASRGEGEGNDATQEPGADGPTS